MRCLRCRVGTSSPLRLCGHCQSCVVREESARLFHALTYRIGQKALITKMLEALESDNPEGALEAVRLCM